MPHASPPSRITIPLVLLLAAATRLCAWLPGTGSPNAVQGFVVAPASRTDVLAFYNTVYTASADYAGTIAWTGSIAGGNEGTTSGVFKDQVRRRINFFRALAGLPADITFDATKSAKDQRAALMFSANNALSHTPPATWTWYTADGAAAAGSSNIALGLYGPGAVDAYIRDDGSNNIVVGHRRWLLYSRAQIMGTGDVPASAGYNAANAVWVIGDFKPAPAPAFVAWPNAGYCPFSLLPARWSLSHPGADFGAATVTLTRDGAPVVANIISRTANGYGDNTLVWEPQSLPTSITADIPYQVSVAGITGSGVPASFTYTVTFFDPAVLGGSVAISGPSTPSVTGAAYTFTPVEQADAYQLRVSTASSEPWAEGAEDATAAYIQSFTTGAYALRQAAQVRTGVKSFHLAFPGFSDQGFVLLRDVIPTVASQLQFFERGLFATTTTTLGAEVSTDGGSTWTVLWSRPGVGLSSANWDAAYNNRSIGLAAYAGRTIRVRFILRSNGGSIVVSTDNNSGFFLDDITVTNAGLLTNTTVTDLPGSATGFSLDAATAGAPLVAGNGYVMRIRPQVGTRWYGDGPATRVTAAAGYAAWAAAQTPALTGGPLADQDNDGLSNGIEYAFGLDPVRATAATALPAPTLAGGVFGVTFTPPPGLSGVTYGAQWSTDLATWTAIPDTGTLTTRTFEVAATGQSRMFFRHVITVVP